MDNELETALLAIETELKLSTPMGIKRSTPNLRFLLVITEIKKKLCPHKDEILDKLNSSKAQVIVTLSDALLCYVTSLPIVAATLAKYISEIGLNKFCQDPTYLLTVKLDDE